MNSQSVVGVVGVVVGCWCLPIIISFFLGGFFYHLNRKSEDQVSRRGASASYRIAKPKKEPGT